LKPALLVLAFIFFYKLGDSLCTALATAFYMDIGFSMSEIGLISKNAGLWCSVIGGTLGGLWMLRLGINRALWLFGLVQVFSILGFTWLAWLGPPFFAARDYSELAPDELVQTVADKAFTNACAYRSALAGDPRNARTFADNMLRPYFNFDRMTELTVGAGWGKAKDAQKKQLSDAFHSVLIRKYYDVVYQYCDHKLDIKTLEVDGTRANVNVEMNRGDGAQQPVSVVFSLESPESRKDQKNKAWKIVDVAVNGQSLVSDYRDVFADKTRGEDGIKGLISWLKDQITIDFWACLALAVVVGIEAMGVGLGSAAFFAFMARTTHPAYLATQLALFTSLMATPRTLINATAGWLVEGMGGWVYFFWLCFFLAFPGMLLLFKVAPWNGDRKPAPPAAESEAEAAPVADAEA